MENFPKPVSITMQPCAMAPASTSGPTTTTCARAQPVPSPQDFVLWSFFNTFFCNPFCLGFLALIFSIKARDCKVLGDLEGARRHGARAKALNVIGSVLLVLSVAIAVAIFLSAFTFRAP